MDCRPPRSRPGDRYVMPGSGMDRYFNDPQRYGRYGRDGSLKSRDLGAFLPLKGIL